MVFSVSTACKTSVSSHTATHPGRCPEPRQNQASPACLRSIKPSPSPPIGDVRAHPSRPPRPIRLRPNRTSSSTAREKSRKHGNDGDRFGVVPRKRLCQEPRHDGRRDVSRSTGGRMAVYTLPDLDYDYGALEPHISGKIDRKSVV